MAELTIPKNGFSDKWLENLKTPEKRIEVADPKAKGLRLRITPTGTKTFIWIYKQHGKFHRLTLGQWGKAETQITLSKARILLEQNKEKLKDGKLIGTPEDAPDSVEKLADEFYKHKKRDPNLKRPERIKQVIEHDIKPVLGKKKIKQVTKQMAISAVKKVVNRGAATHAGTVLDAIRQMFQYAEDNGYLGDQPSPAASLKAKSLGVARNVKDRTLDYDPDLEHFDEDMKEIKAFWSVLDQVPKLSKQINYGLKILLLTGVRSGELRLAEWKHIDLEKGIWSIPASHTKNNRAWKVPLTQPAIDLFESLKEVTGKTDYVMASTASLPKDKEHKTGRIEDKAIARSVKRIFDKKDKDGNPILDIPAFTPHDLRRTMRSWLSHLGVMPHIAEKCLNHSLGKIFETYDKAPMIDERREALELWSKKVMEAVSDE